MTTGVSIVQLSASGRVTGHQRVMTAVLSVLEASVLSRLLTTPLLTEPIKAMY